MTYTNTDCEKPSRLSFVALLGCRRCFIWRSISFCGSFCHSRFKDWAMNQTRSARIVANLLETRAKLVPRENVRILGKILSVNEWGGKQDHHKGSHDISYRFHLSISFKQALHQDLPHWFVPSVPPDASSSSIRSPPVGTPTISVAGLGPSFGRLPALADDCNPLHTCFVFQSLQLFFGSHPVLYIVSLFAAALTIELMSSASDFVSRWCCPTDHGNLLGCQHAGRSAGADLDLFRLRLLTLSHMQGQDPGIAAIWKFLSDSTLSFSSSRTNHFDELGPRSVEEISRAYDLAACLAFAFNEE
jgi:hypothetical protein